MNRDLIVIGGSAGSVEAVLQLARDLPADLPATLIVVIHVAPESRGELAGLVDRASRLKGVPASQGEAIRKGHIYVAKPDHHVRIEAGRLVVDQGPKEKRHRPAIDPLFRSAAVGYGPRSIGVILSGYQDDGAAGLALIRKQDGVAVVQDPMDARRPEMPRNAIAAAAPQHIVRLPDLAGLLDRLCREEPVPGAS